jgi:Mrp family chromosome partitioning ATPase
MSDHQTPQKGSSDPFHLDPNPLNHFKKTIAVVSGKGGVGKSLVTALMAVLSHRRGLDVGILDADVTGPSIPRIFGLEGKRPENAGSGIFPVMTESGIRVMSINLLLEDNDSPVVWRGPLIAGTVKQFWTDVVWGSLDRLFIDMPPGTGDVPLTVFQSIPLDGILVVTSPQDLVTTIVRKAYRMAGMMGIPILGIIENMSYAVCPDCGRHIDLFGKSKAEEVAKGMNIPLLGRIPVHPGVAALCDAGRIEDYDRHDLDDALDALNAILEGAQS